jgi:ring-1,2-phenylacetyl-CoA epoxidase subunit PaaB
MARALWFKYFTENVLKFSFSIGCYPFIFNPGSFKQQQVNSIDPRVNRLPKMGQSGTIKPKAQLDQFGTFEVFVQPKEGKPFQNEGIVHAPNLEMAWVLAKETFTRRFTCTSLYVADTRNVFVSPMTEGNKSAYDCIAEVVVSGENQEPFEIFHLAKRGKQHLHAGRVHAANPQEAMSRAKKEFGAKAVMNVWALRTANIRFTTGEEIDLWNTLPEKKFRDASEYKGGDRLKELIDRLQT